MLCLAASRATVYMVLHKVNDGKEYRVEMDDIDRKHGELLLSSLNSLRIQNKLCDVVLHVQDNEIPAHRVVLAAVSPYFSAMFTSPVLESGQKTVTLKGMDFCAVQAVVGYTYTACINVTVTNVQTLFSVASFFQVEAVVHKCCNFLESELHPSNSLGVKKFAQQHGCNKLARKSLQYAQKHFNQVTQHEEYLHMSSEEVFEFIKDPEDSIEVYHEEEVYEAVMRWVKFDFHKRLPTVPLVAAVIRFPFLAWDFLVTKVLDDGLITGNSLSLLYFEQARHLHMFMQQRKLYGDSCTMQLRPRKLFGQAEWMYVVGGETSPGRRVVGTVEKFSPSSGKWCPVSMMLVPRRSHGVAMLNGLLFAVGGSDVCIAALNQVECYSHSTDTWRPAVSMNECRSSLGVAVLDGMLYAVGGYNGHETVNTVERYNPVLEQWTAVAHMISARSLLGVAVLNGFLYAVGGYDGNTDLSTVERYDSYSNRWSPVASMKICRSMLGLAVTGGLLYAVGGSAGESLSTVEAYSSEEDTWTIVAPMRELRCGVGVAAVNGLLYAVGGDNGSDYLDSVECYNPSKSRWTVVQSMSKRCRRFGCCS